MRACADLTRTVAVVSDAGARVVCASEVVPEFGRLPGKGEALWKALFATDGAARG